MFDSGRNYQTVQKWLYHVALTPAACESFCCSTSFTEFGGVSVTGYGHSNRCASQCFNLHFPDNICDKLGRTDILIMLSLPIHEHFSIYLVLNNFFLKFKIIKENFY